MVCLPRFPSSFSNAYPRSSLNAVFPLGKNLDFSLKTYCSYQGVLLCNLSDEDLIGDQVPKLSTGEFLLRIGPPPDDEAKTLESPERGSLWQPETRFPFDWKSSAVVGVGFAFSPEFFNDMLGFLGIGLDFCGLYELQATLMDPDTMEIATNVKIWIQKAIQEHNCNFLWSSWLEVLEDYFLELFQGLFTLLKAKQEALEQGVGKKDLTREQLVQSLIRGKNFLERNYHQSLDLHRISQVAGLSKFHFLRLFKTVFGRTPKQYLTVYRLERARRILIFESRSVTETALSVGYSSLSSFIHAFQGHFWVFTEKLK